MSFAEDYGFGDAHVELLRASGMVLEAAEVLANSSRITDAVKILIATPRAQDRTRRAVEYISSGLWRHQSFGTEYPTTDPAVVSDLLGLAGTLKNGMREAEAQEVCSLFSFSIALTLE